MAKFKRKSRWKSILCGILVVAALVGACAGIAVFSKKETETLSKFNMFDVGSISEETGEYVECDDKLYTKKLIKCLGLEITPDFDSNVDYQLFWYNEDEMYFGHTEVLNDKYIGPIPEAARYCRIMVIPSTLDEDGKVIKDFSIKFYEKSKYVKNLTIKVDKNQEWSPVDYYEAAQDSTAPVEHTPAINDGYMFYNNWYLGSPVNFDEGFVFDADSNAVSIKLDCKDVAKYKITFNENDTSHSVKVVFFEASGTSKGVYTYSGVPGESIIIPCEDAAYVVFAVSDLVKPIVINNYLPR